MASNGNTGLMGNVTVKAHSNGSSKETSAAGKPLVVFPPWNLEHVINHQQLYKGPSHPVATITATARYAAHPASNSVPPFNYPPSNYKCLDSRQSLLGKVLSIVGTELPGSTSDPAVLFNMRCLNNRDFVVRVRTSTSFVPLTLYDGEPRGVYPPSNSQEAVQNMTPEKILKDLQQYVKPGLFVMVSGVAFETGRMDASVIYNMYSVTGEVEPRLVFEEPDWWRDQITELSDCWLRGIFKTPDDVDWSHYTTNQGIAFGAIEGMADQEVATLSRLIYGLASAFHLTGNKRFLNAAASGVEYQRRNFKLPDVDGDAIFWVAARNGRRFQVTSTSGDDRGTIPCYEQIYALAGLAQYYRITLDPEVLAEIKGTVRAFRKYFYDTSEYQGFFSHIDFATKSPHAESLKATDNYAKKNWNSVGDHIPAYLINTILALENGSDLKFRAECIDILKECTRLIITQFVDRGLAHEASNGGITLVPERFLQNWTLDTTYSWQQNRGIVGHNLKIVWNLHRAANFLVSIDPDLSWSARNAADTLLQRLIPEGGLDGFRGGCFDALERDPGCGSQTFTWLNTKDFWQQEQAILALLISYGAEKKPEYLDHARGAQAFYNTFFLNKDEESVFFRTNADGTSVMEGVYGQQASHAKSGYHTHENAFLSFLYNNSFVNKADFCMYFHPTSKTSETLLCVLPDFLAAGTLKVQSAVAVDFPHIPLDHAICGLDSGALLVSLPPEVRGSTLQVRFTTGAAVAPLPTPIPTVEKKGKIGILIESQYVEDEIRYYQEVLASNGYQVEFLSNLKQWGLQQNTFYGNDYRTPLVVSTDFQTYIDNPLLLRQEGYKGFLLSAGYAMDRLRYDPNRLPGKPNSSFAVQFLKLIDADPSLVIGGCCHSLWLYCALPELIKGREVACAPNVVDDVENAGGKVVYTTNGDGLALAHVDGSMVGQGRAVLVTGTGLSRVGNSFMNLYVSKLRKLSEGGCKRC